MTKIGSSDYNSLRRLDSQRQSRWFWFGAVAAFSVFIFMYSQAYEFFFGDPGPVKCKDGWSSSSIGSAGACSYHGGIDYGPIRAATRSARQAALFTSLPVSGVVFLLLILLERVTSPHARRLRKINKDDAPEQSVKDVHNQNTLHVCERCGGELVTRSKKFKDRLPDREIWTECKRCRARKHLLLE